MITYETLRELGKPIAYFPKLAKPLGGANAAIMFSHLQYWQERTDNELGVYKTKEELEEETGLSDDEQDTACKKLQCLGILTKTYKRLQHRMYYKLNPEAFDRVMADFAEKKKQVSGSGKNGVAEQDNPVLPNTEKQVSGSGKNGVRIRNKDYIQRLHTEITEKDVCASTSHTPESLQTENAELANAESQAEKPSKAKRQSKHDADLALLAEYGVTGQLAEDYIAHRKIKKAVITRTVLNALQRDVEKICLEFPDFTLEKLITMQLMNNWQAIRADWAKRLLREELAANQSQARPSARDVPIHTQGGLLAGGKRKPQDLPQNFDDCDF